MGTTLCVSRWIFLLTLAVVMLFSASEVDSYPNVGLPCFHKSTNTTIRIIKQCYEQKPRQDCNHHVFVVTNKRGTWSIDPTAQWLQDKLKTGKLNCPPDISPV